MPCNINRAPVTVEDLKLKQHLDLNLQGRERHQVSKAFISIDSFIVSSTVHMQIGLFCGPGIVYVIYVINIRTILGKMQFPNRQYAATQDG